jgi:hypothetical protein
MAPRHSVVRRVALFSQERILDRPPYGVRRQSKAATALLLIQSRCCFHSGVALRLPPHSMFSALKILAVLPRCAFSLQSAPIHKRFDEPLFVPYRSVGFMSRNRCQVKGPAHVVCSASQILAERGWIGYDVQRLVDSSRISRLSLVPHL